MRKRRNIILDDDQYDHLRLIAYQRTAEERQAVSVAELIRRAIAHTYGAPRDGTVLAEPPATYDPEE